MAGAILSVEVLASGREAAVTVEGVSTGGTYLYDAANGDLVDPATAKIVFTVVSKSFDATGAATTITRTVYGAVTQRTPGSASLSETVAGSDVVIVVGLSEPIYAKDKAGVGNSGTDPTVAFLAGWYTQGGTPSEAGTPTVTNNSALAYYVPFGQWDILPAERVSANFRVAFSARHLHGIACVKLTATGATSAASVSSTVTAETARQRTVSGFYATAHEAMLAIAGFTQDEQIDLKAELFPTVGDVEMDTADNGSDVVAAGRGPRHCICDKGDTLRTYGFVTSGAGGGTASTTLATAQADPFPTIKAARDADCTQIYLNGTAHNFDTRAANEAEEYSTVIEPAPGNSSTVVVTINGAFPTPRVKWLKFKGVTIRLSATNSVLYGADRTEYVMFENCPHDDGGFAAAEGHVDFEGVFYKDCTFDDGASWDLRQVGSDKFRFTFDGCVIPTPGIMGAFWRMVACRVTGATSIANTVAAADTKPSNVLMEFNEITGFGGSASVTVFSHATQAGNSMIGNIIEGITASVTPGQLSSIAEDSAFDIDHIIIAHNTIVGERSNWFYNSTGSTAYHSRGIRHVGNIHQELDTKHDDFGTPDAARIGRWWFNYGTGSAGNLSIDTNFTPEWPGLRYITGDDPEFADDLTGSTGGGDYSLSATSPALGLLAAGDRVAAFDLYGTAIPNDGTGAAGAVQRGVITLAAPARRGRARARMRSARR